MPAVKHGSGGVMSLAYLYKYSGVKCDAICLIAKA